MTLPRWLFKDRSLGYKFSLLAIVPVIIVSLFIVFISMRTLEKQMINRTLMQARGLMRLSGLSVSNAFVIYNKHLIDNFVDSLMVEDIVVYAMIIDANDNRILAHNNHLNDGHIYDEAQHSFGPSVDRLSSLSIDDLKHGEIYEVSGPIVINDIEYGVVRLGFSVKKVLLQIDEMKSRVMTIALVTVALGLLSSMLLARILNKPIKGLARQAEKIGAGDFEQKMVYESRDDLGYLAQSFNKMAEELEQNIGMLKENESKYRALFEYSPMSLWEEDMSDLKRHIDNLSSQGITNFRKYFDEHPEDIGPCINMIHIIDVNKSTLELYEADAKEQFLKNLKHIRKKETLEILINGVIALAEGKPVEFEASYKTLSGKDITVLIRATIPPGYEKTWSKAFISILDITEREKAERLEEMFGRFLSPKIMNSMLENPDAINLGGEKRKLTIMMTDLRGFTAITERMEPEDVVHMLNSYFEVMVDVALQFNGTIIEIIGDAMLIIFGAPQEMPDQATRAIACAIAMQNAMSELQARNRERGYPELEMGIGLNEAEVIVGNIGSTKRSKYGVVGSGVNMTGRIESYSVGGQILISESVRQEGGEILRLNDRLVVHPKGAETPITIYEVGGIGEPYSLVLEREPEELLNLNREIPISYTVLDGKYVGEGKSVGAIIRLSKKSGELRLQTPLDSLTNIKLNLQDVGEVLSGKDFYAKVAERSKTDPNITAVQFTSLPPTIESYFQAALDQRT